jgi:hypothetical protein
VRHKLATAKVCDWCGGEFEQLYDWAGTQRFYCSGKCRALGYKAERVWEEWVLLRVLGKAYSVIEAAGLNFELEVRRGDFPGLPAVRAEWKQFIRWAGRFLVDEAGVGAVPAENGAAEVAGEHAAAEVELPEPPEPEAAPIAAKKPRGRKKRAADRSSFSRGNESGA